MQVRPYAPLLVTALALAAIPVHHALHEARPLDQAAVVSYPQHSSTSVDSDTLDIRRAKIRASRSMARTPVVKPKPHVVHENVHPSVPRETHVHVARPHIVYAGSANAWANQNFSIRVANCESGGTRQGDHYDGNPHVVASNGHYGKWQFAWSTWESVGGTGNPAYASEAEQDYRAWLLWKRDGWGQWECASEV